MKRSNPGIVQTGADAVRLFDLPLLILENHGLGAMKDAGTSPFNGGCGSTAVHPFSSRLHTNQADLFFEKGQEQSKGIGPPAKARHEMGGVNPLVFTGGERLFPNDAMEFSHHHRVRVRAHSRANDIVRFIRVGDPMPHGFIRRILERLGACLRRPHLGAQQAHALDIGLLPFHVLRPHEDGAWQTGPSASRGGGHTVLARSGLRDDVPFPHAPRQQNLAHRIVDFVGPGVGEVLPLEPDGGPAPFTPAVRPLKGSRSADKIPKQSGIGRFEFRVIPGLFKGLLEIEEIPPQHFRNELPAELSIVAVLNDGMLRHDVQSVLN